MTGLLQTILIIMGITWALSVLLIGLVFSMAANERRKELGVLRALGATRLHIFKSLLAESSLLALIGGASRHCPGRAGDLPVQEADHGFAQYPLLAAVAGQLAAPDLRAGCCWRCSPSTWPLFSRPSRSAA